METVAIIQTEIKTITVTQVGGVTPSETVKLELDNAGEITACPEGATHQNGVTFNFTIEGEEAALKALNAVYYRAYTNLKWRLEVNEEQLAGNLNSSTVNFTVTAARGNRPAGATGALTLFFPEKLAGAKVAVCFGLTEGDVAATNPAKPGLRQDTVKYVKVGSAVINSQPAV